LPSPDIELHLQFEPVPPIAHAVSCLVLMPRRCAGDEHLI
jgi:hypothetical protein